MNDKLKKKTWEEELMDIMYGNNHGYQLEVISFVRKLQSETRERTLEELYQAYDAKYKDFELTKALGSVLQELKKG